MNKILLIGLALIATACHKEKSTNPTSNRMIVDDFVNSFYSFDRDSLEKILAYAPGSQPEILYYQKWAECAHYQIANRGVLIEKNDSTIVCPVTVKDDLMAALQIDFNVTDTFHIAIKDGHISSVKTSSNDPEEYYQAKAWVKENRPEYIEKQCEGIWEGGPTPCECVQGMLKGFGEFVVSNNAK